VFSGKRFSLYTHLGYPLLSADLLPLDEMFGYDVDA
jgi:hypothetical protein